MNPDTIWMSTADANQLRRLLRQAGVQCRLLQGPVLGYWRVQANPNFPPPPEELHYEDPVGV